MLDRLTEVFCEVDDFCQAFDAQWQAYLRGSGAAPRESKPSLAVSEIRTAAGKTGELTRNPMWQQDTYRMIQRRAADAGIKTRIGNHTFRATGITAYLKNNGTLEAAQHIANYESPRTTKLYDSVE